MATAPSPRPCCGSRRRNWTRVPAKAGGRRGRSCIISPTARWPRPCGSGMILAEDRPAFSRSDQDEYARRLHYDRPHESSLELFRYAREATAELLERMTPADWLREGVHTTSGAFGAERWLQIYGRTPTSTPARSAPRATPRRRQSRASQSVLRVRGFDGFDGCGSTVRRSKVLEALATTGRDSRHLQLSTSGTAGAGAGRPPDRRSTTK